MSNVWEKFNELLDLEGLKQDLEDVASNTMKFREVPAGKYEISINKMELTESKTGRPMLTVWMKILAGEYENQMIFYNQVIDNAYGLHNANKFLRALESGLDVEFKDFEQYNDLILDVHEAIDEKLEYALKYGKNKKGFNTFEITDVFEK